MRRGARTVLPSEPPSPQKQQTPNAGLAERARAAPALAKLVVLGILAMGMYVALLALEERSEIGPITGDDPVNGLSPSEGLKRGYRQLKMMGFESEGGTGGGWKTCRRFEEKDLAPHKKPGQVGHDPYMRIVQPTPGADWEFAISESADAEWLGLHQWDDRFEYGSKEANRRVEKLGYCRVHMPSVPRTGSTWFRAMFEAATGQPTFSMWQEGGTMKEKYVAFSSDDPCGASLDHMEGRLTSTKKFPCRDVRPPNATSPILYKSHTPYFPSYNKPSLMPEETCMLLLLVRNPIDNQDAWMRYMAGKGEILREYLPVWQGHLSHWIASAGDIPIYVFRYEDMLYRAEDVLRNILQTLPGGWHWSEESIAKAMRMYGPKKPFLDKCGAGFKGSTVAEVDMVRKHYGSYLRHFGYRFIDRS